jgi:hypothetical protein
VTCSSVITTGFGEKENYKMEKEAENVDEGMVKDKARSQPWHHP